MLGLTAIPALLQLVSPNRKASGVDFHLLRIDYNALHARITTVVG